MRAEPVARQTAKMASSAQFAALPYRMRDGVLEILLITTLRTRRWIVPKGWPVEGQPPQASAAVEALEEAGISGEIASKPFGFYRYMKLRKNGDSVPCKVDVFPLKVTRQHRSWAEKDTRQKRWCSVNEALALIGEPGLRPLIAKFAASVTAAH